MTQLQFCSGSRIRSQESSRQDERLDGSEMLLRVTNAARILQKGLDERSSFLRKAPWILCVNDWETRSWGTGTRHRRLLTNYILNFSRVIFNHDLEQGRIHPKDISLWTCEPTSWQDPVAWTPWISWAKPSVPKRCRYAEIIGTCCPLEMRKPFKLWSITVLSKKIHSKREKKIVCFLPNASWSTLARQLSECCGMWIVFCRQKLSLYSICRDCRKSNST